MKLILCALAFLMLSVTAFGQDKVANYSTGKVGKNYEHFSFWVRGQQREVIYWYGSGNKELPLTYGGVERCNGAPCFKVTFSNGRTFRVRPVGHTLQITGNGKYSKRFRWEYEGPRNGIGTFCDSCTENENEAMKLIRESYLK